MSVSLFHMNQNSRPGLHITFAAGIQFAYLSLDWSNIWTIRLTKGEAFTRNVTNGREALCLLDRKQAWLVSFN